MIKELIDEINKDLKNSIMYLVDDGSPSEVSTFIPTGCTALDYIISNQDKGGIPVGRLTEIAGLEASGKSLLAMQICANAQKLGGLCVYIDTENSFNETFAKQNGLDFTKEDFFLAQPYCVEDVFSMIIKLSHKLDDYKKKNKKGYPFAIVVWDSLAATPCKSDIDNENPSPTADVGLKARVISKGLSMLYKTIGAKNIAFVVINQLRTVIPPPMFGEKFFTPGGKSLHFASSVRLQMQSIGRISNADKEVLGIKTRVKCIKTKFGPPHRMCEFPLYFSHGIDDPESIIDVLKEKDLVKIKNQGRKGNGYYFSDEPDTVMKKNDFKKLIKHDDKVRKKVMKLMSKIMLKEMVDPYEVDLKEEKFVGLKEEI